MENILILGAAGNIGYDLLLKLIEKEYLLTAFDLNTKNNKKKLNILKDNVEIIYGDIEDKHLIKELVKNKDIIINCAGIMPPFSNLDDNIANTINYKGTKNLIDAINEYNPNCKFFYLSFISVYGTSDKNKEIKIKNELNDSEDLYTKSIIKSEEYIKNYSKKYCILRMPIVLTPDNYFLRHLRLNRQTDFITVDYLNNIILNIIKKKEVNQKVYNISGFKADSKEFLIDLYQTTGELNILGRDLYYGHYIDSECIEKIVEIKKNSYKQYLEELKENTKPIKRKIKKILNYYKYLIIIKKTKKDQ